MPLDIRKAALEAGLDQEPLYVKKWGAWITVRELPGDERADLLESCMTIIGKGKNATSKMNIKRLYSRLAVLSARYPDPDDLPAKDHPQYAAYPGAVDERGNFLTEPDPRAGELIFPAEDAGALLKRSGAVLELIAGPASRLSALLPEQIEEKKDGSQQESGESEDSTTE